jgi:hypothetical protein
MEPLREALRPAPNYEPYTITAVIPCSFMIRWASDLTKDLGYLPYRGKGWVVGLGILLGFALAALVVDYGIYRMGMRRAMRAGLWLGAMFGPYMAMWGVLEAGAPIPVTSQIAGAVGTLLAFGFGYVVSVALERRRLL